MKINKILIVFILALAFILRIYGINWGLPSEGYYFSYLSDEVGYIKGLGQMDPAKLDFNPRYFNWGAWHYYELGGVIALASLLDIVKLTKDKYFYYKNPLEMAKIYLAGRFLSIFFALLTVFLVYLIGKKIYSSKVGLLAGFFMAINPSHIIHSHRLKADTSVTFWIVLLLLCTIYLLQTGRLKWYVLSGMASAFAAGSQQNGLCFMHTLLFAHLLREYKDTVGFGYIKKALFSKKLLYGYIAVFITYLMVNPYWFSSLRAFIISIHSFTSQGDGLSPPDILINTLTYCIDFTYRSNILIDTFKAFNMGLSPFFVFLGLYGIVYGIISRSKKTLLILVWLLPYLSFIIVTGALDTRYQMLVFPGLFVLMAGGIYFIYSKLSWRNLRGLLAVCIVFSSLYTIAYSYAYDRELAKKTIQRLSSEWLISNVPSGTKIGIARTAEISNCPEVVHQDY